MFNKEFKESYIKKRLTEANIHENTLTSMFKTIGEFEESYGKDACNFVESEILNVFKSLNRSSVGSIYNLKSQLGKYTTYCIEHNLVNDGQNHYYNISTDQINGCVSQTILNDKIITKENMIYYSNLMELDREKYIMWSLFEGIRGDDFKEISMLTIKDIDIDKKEVTTYTGRVVSVSIEFINSAIECNEHLEYRKGEGRLVRLENSDKIFKLVAKKQTVDRPESVRAGREIYRCMKSVVKSIIGNEYLTATDIVDSGRLHYIIELSKENNVNPRDIIYSKEWRGVVEKKYPGINNQTVLWNKYKNYLEDSISG